MTENGRSGGTVRYTAPELTAWNTDINESSGSEEHFNSRETDVFALAMTMYEVGTFIYSNESFDFTQRLHSY